MVMSLASVKLGIRKDGYIRASELEAILTEIAQVLADEFRERDREISSLRRELEQERRLRLGMKGAQR